MSALKAAFGIGLVAFLIYHVGIGDTLERVYAMPLWFIPMALAYYLACQVLSTIRWQVLLSTRGIETGFSRLFRLYMIGMFANNFLPGAVGGDAVKAVGIYRDGKPGGLAVASVLVERFLGLAALGTLGLFAAVPVLARQIADPVILLATVGTAAVIALAGLVVWFPPISSRIGRRLGNAGFGRVGKSLNDLFDATRVYWLHKRALALAFFLSLVVQIMIGIYYVIAARAAAIDFDFIYFFAFLPAITLVSMAPISIGGLGVREVTMLFLFSRVGVEGADVLAISLVIHALNTLLSLTGGAILLWDAVVQRATNSRLTATPHHGMDRPPVGARNED